jgi:GNAT superfamily N-acetyltransferase
MRPKIEPVGGETMLFRRLWPREQDEILAHLLRLDPDDRQLRFGGVMRDGDIAAYVGRMNWSRSLIVGCEIGGVLRAIGELKAIRRDWRPTAEVAVTVERPFQDRGIGARLFRRLVTLAANRGFRRLYVLCVAQNRRMRNIVLHHGASLTHYESEVEGEVDLPWPSHLTLAQEMIDAYVAAVQSALAPALSSS